MAKVSTIVRRTSDLKKYKKLAKAIGNEYDNVIKPHYLDQFKEIVEPWNSYVHFRARKVITDTTIKVYIYPTGRDKNVWFYVDEGTEDHDITAKNAPFLSFPNGKYIPRTKPIAKTGGMGRVFGTTAQVNVYSVRVSGIEARQFTITIKNDKKNLDFTKKKVRNTIRRVFR